MNIFLTGATGYIGNLLAYQLADKGDCVHALVHSRGNATLLRHKNIKIFFGDINNREEIKDAIKGCEQAYHIAAQVKPWMKDPSAIYKVNVEGTSNVFGEALQANVKKVVFTSTCGVLGPALNEPLDETSPRLNDFSLDYDRSKKMGEDVALDYVHKGLNIVVVSPAKVYGPGRTSHPFTGNAMIGRFLKTRIAFIPSPGTYKVCFTYVEDVLKGHILAMEKGRTGEKYILGGHNIAHYDFFDCVRRLTNFKARIIRVPKPLIKFAAFLEESRHAITGAEISFSVKSVDYVFNNYIFSSKKAIQELGYTITPLNEALSETIQFLKTAK
jgi:nucleoside-diphosphate-sugar epimerase